MLMRYEVLPSLLRDSARDARVIEIKVDMLLTLVAEAIDRRTNVALLRFGPLCALSTGSLLCLPRKGSSQSKACMFVSVAVNYVFHLAGAF